MKHTTLMTRTISFLLALVLCVPTLFVLTSPASAAEGRTVFSIGSTACQENLSRSNPPSGVTTASVGQTVYINVAATEDIKLKRIDAYVSINNGSYLLVGSETANSFLRWAAFPYQCNSGGAVTFFVKVYYLDGSTAEGSTDITVTGALQSPAYSVISDGYYFLASALDDSMVLDVWGDVAGYGTNVQLYHKKDKDNAANQIYHIIHVKGDWYKIVPLCDESMCVELYGGVVTGTEHNISTWAYHEKNNDGQLWCFKSNSDGTYSIHNKLGLAMDLARGNTEDESNICACVYHGEANQRWFLQRTFP